MSAILPEKLFDLRALECHVVQRVVGRVEQQDDLDRRIATRKLGSRSIDGLEGTYLLRFVVVEQGKIPLLKAGDGLPRSIGHQDIEFDLARWSVRIRGNAM